MYGKYAVALFPEVQEITRTNRTYSKYCIKRTNIEIYDAEDNLDYSLLNKLPLDLIPEKIVCEYDELEEVEIENGVLVKYRGQDSEFTIPNDVTSIAELAFSECTLLKSISISSSITKISDRSFCGCLPLESIYIPDSVTSIGRYAFYGCCSLKSIDIPNSVTSIDDSAFMSCISLTSITIPDSVTYIGNYAFSYCKSLTSITIPDSVTSVGYSIFDGSLSLKVVRTNNKYIKKYCNRLGINVQPLF